MKVKFTPTLCAGSEYSGHVILKMPTYSERLSFYSNETIDETSGEPGKEPETDAEKSLAKKRTSKKGMAMMQEIGNRLDQFIVEVNIVRKKDNFILNTFEHLNYDSEMIGVLTECAQRIIGKYEVGSPQ